jgi:hypothetical protein
MSNGRDNEVTKGRGGKDMVLMSPRSLVTSPSICDLDNEDRASCVFRDVILYMERHSCSDEIMEVIPYPASMFCLSDESCFCQELS